MRFSNLMKFGLLVSILSAIQSDMVLGQYDQHYEPQQDAQSASGFHLHGLLDTIASPFKTTIRQARRLLGHRLESINDFVQDGTDILQTQTFKMFMQLYNKTYLPSEIPRRMMLFSARRKQIEESIKAYTAGKLPFMMRENPYIDWEEHELKALTGVSPPKSINELTPEEQTAIFGKQQQTQPLVASNGEQKQEANYYTIEEPTGVWRAPNIDGLDFGRQPSDDEEDGYNITVGATVSIPGRMDWRDTGCIAEPINQQKCGCCYAIATMGVLESMRCLKKVFAPVLSPQQIIDCSTPRAGYQNFGCNGGWPTRVLRYLQNVGVAARQTCYPLVLRQGICKLRKVQSVEGCSVSASPTNGRLRYKVLNNEKDILYHVAKTGPVVTVMRATDKFLYYGSGIFDDPTCSRKADDVDHAISIVGYGRENGIDYWLIKNSWGAEWGLNGYGKYRRGTNACSIGHWGWVIVG